MLLEKKYIILFYCFHGLLQKKGKIERVNDGESSRKNLSKCRKRK